jgi:Integrase core domain
MNAICERLIGTPRRELLDRTLDLNQAHLRAVLADYQEHYNTARPHQGIDQRLPDHGPGPRVTAADPGTCQIRRKPILSGLINEYERAAWRPGRPRSKPESYFRAAQGQRPRIGVAFYLDEHAWITVPGTDDGRPHLHIAHGEVSVSISTPAETLTAQDVVIAHRLADVAAEYAAEIERLSEHQQADSFGPTVA